MPLFIVGVIKPIYEQVEPTFKKLEHALRFRRSRHIHIGKGQDRVSGHSMVRKDRMFDPDLRAKPRDVREGNSTLRVCELNDGANKWDFSDFYKTMDAALCRMGGEDREVDVDAYHSSGLTVELSGARAYVWAWHFILHASAPTKC